MYSDNPQNGDIELKKSDVDLPEFKLQKAEKYLKRAWIAGAISGIITFIYSFMGAYNETIRYKYGLDTWTLIDVAIIAGLSYGIYRKNRLSALGMLVYFIASKFVIFASTGQFSGGLLTLVFGYFFFQGTRAAFWLHKYSIEIGEVQKKIRKRGFSFFLQVSGLLVLTAFLILLIAVAIGPGTEVIPGKFLKKKYAEFIKQEKLISPKEEIAYWYSDALIDFRKGFYFITDKNVVLYNRDWVEPAMIISYSNISDVQFEHNPSYYEDSIIYLNLEDSSIIFFPVSSDNSGDKLFFKKLMQNWKKYKSNKVTHQEIQKDFEDSEYNISSQL